MKKKDEESFVQYLIQYQIKRNNSRKLHVSNKLVTYLNSRNRNCSYQPNISKLAKVYERQDSSLSIQMNVAKKKIISASNRTYTQMCMRHICLI